MDAGSYVAIVTPLTDDGSAIDFDALGALIDWHLEQGTDGIVPAGTTGEAATMTHEEQMDVIRFTVERVAGRAKVVAGTGSNNTAEALRLTRSAKDSGVDGALVVTPYYNKPTPKGIRAHYAAIAKECDLPIMLYNVPARTGTNMLPDLVIDLYESIEQVKAIKEASGNVTQAAAIRARSDIAIFSGEDALTLPLMSVGANGSVSVVANIMPADNKALVQAALNNDMIAAREAYFKMLAVVDALFVETNPIPVKTALTLMGKINGMMRSPLMPLEPSSLQTLKAALKDAGLLP